MDEDKEETQAVRVEDATVDDPSRMVCLWHGGAIGQNCRGRREKGEEGRGRREDCGRRRQGLPAILTEATT
jgi:hypothetical protein